PSVASPCQGLAGRARTGTASPQGPAGQGGSTRGGGSGGPRHAQAAEGHEPREGSAAQDQTTTDRQARKAAQRSDGQEGVRRPASGNCRRKEGLPTIGGRNPQHADGDRRANGPVAGGGQ